MISPIIERLYMLLIIIVYFLLRKSYANPNENKDYNRSLLIVELFCFFSIFDNFLAVPVGGFTAKLQYVFLVLYWLFTSKFIISFSGDKTPLKKVYFSLLLVFVIQLASVFWMRYNLGVIIRIILVLIQSSLLVIIYSVLSRKEDKTLLIQNISLIGLFSASVGIIEFIIQQVTGLKIPFPVISRKLGNTHPDLLSRAFGFMFEPNWYGFQLIIFFYIYLFLSKKIKAWPIVIFGIAQIASGNKITVLVYLGTVLWLLMSKGVIKSKLIKIVGLVGFALFGVLVASIESFQEIFLSRIMVTLNAFQNYTVIEMFTYYDRFAFIWLLIQGYLESPIIGQGLNASLIIHHQLPWKQLPISEIKGNMIAGSGVFRIFFEQGILGVLSIIYVMRTMIKYSSVKAYAWLYLISFTFMTLFYDIWTGLHSIPIIFVAPFLGLKTKFKDDVK